MSHADKRIGPKDIPVSIGSAFFIDFLKKALLFNKSLFILEII